MEWTWDDRKAELNYAKHRVLFATAAAALDDPQRVTLEDPHPDDNRWRTYAMIRSVLLFVVHTDPGAAETSGRIISARRATPAERRAYAHQAPFS